MSGRFLGFLAAGTSKLAAAVVLLLSVLILTAGCGGGKQGPGAGDGLLLNGAGATFPFPLYSRWFAEYQRVEPAVRINYQSIGSGGGIKQLQAGTVDFGASDAPMSDEELAKSKAEILHIPTVLGAVVPAYNLDGVADLKLTSEVIADIFLGNITKWNDRKIAAVNPGVSLPALDIAVAYRSDGSGTTYVFTDYLSSVSGEWQEKVGRGKSVRWPVGLGGKGNEGVSGLIRQTPGAIGYIELIYAEQNNMPYTSVRNAAGKFIKPSLDSVTAAAAGVTAEIPEDLRVSIVNAPGAESYPISAFTYILVYKEQADQAKGRALARFLEWAITDGSVTARELLYAPLPEEVAAKAKAKIGSLTHQGRPLQ